MEGVGGRKRDEVLARAEEEGGPNQHNVIPQTSPIDHRGASAWCIPQTSPTPTQVSPKEVQDAREVEVVSPKEVYEARNVEESREAADDDEVKEANHGLILILG